MARPSRARRIFKWTGTVLLLLFLASWIVGRWWFTFFVLPTNRHYVVSGAGFVGVVKTYYDARVRVSNGFHYHGAAEWGLALPEVETPMAIDELSIVIVPFWLLLLLTAIPTAWLWHRDRRLISSSPDHRLCLRCGYDLTGNTSGVCPECGDKACPPAVLADSECGPAVLKKPTFRGTPTKCRLLQSTRLIRATRLQR